MDIHVYSIEFGPDLDFVIESLFPYCINDLSKLSTILLPLRRTTLLNFSKHFLQYLSTNYLNYTVSQDAVRWWDADRSRVGAVAGVLHAVYDAEKLADIFVDVVKNGVWIDTLPLQRACVLSIASLGPQRLDVLTDHLLASWSDKLSITHTPVMAQERTSVEFLTHNSSHSDAFNFPGAHYFLSTRDDFIVNSLQ